MQTAQSLSRDLDQLHATLTRIAHETGPTCTQCAGQEPAGTSITVGDAKHVRKAVETEIAPGFDQDRHELSITLTRTAIHLDVR
jgi:hypothetical protein